MNSILKTIPSCKCYYILGLVVLSACSSQNEKVDKLSTYPAVPVTVSTPVSENQESIEVNGHIEAGQIANISTKVMGYITAVNVKLGEYVGKGQLLVTLSNKDIIAKKAEAEAQVAEAQANMDNEKKDFDRFTVLYRQQSATTKELDNITLQYTLAKAQLEASKQMLNEVNELLKYTNLTAPFSGIITQTFCDAGSLANPGMPILSIEQTGSYQVSASLAENDINLIKNGDTVIVNLKAVSKTIHGIIAQINPSSQNTGGQYIIKINIPSIEHKFIYDGMYANISIPLVHKSKNLSVENLVIVPASSIINKNQLTGLFTISANNTAILRWVRLGKTYGENVQVLSGLEKSEQFIVSADGKLYDGVPVKIK